MIEPLTSLVRSHRDLPAVLRTMFACETAVRPVNIRETTVADQPLRWPQRQHPRLKSSTSARSNVCSAWPRWLTAQVGLSIRRVLHPPFIGLGYASLTTAGSAGSTAFVYLDRIAVKPTTVASASAGSSPRVVNDSRCSPICCAR